MRRYIRVLIGLFLGLCVGLVLTAVVVLAKVGFLVNTPHAAHPVLIVLLFLVPAAAGVLIGLAWPRVRRS